MTVDAGKKSSFLELYGYFGKRLDRINKKNMHAGFVYGICGIKWEACGNEVKYGAGSDVPADIWSVYSDGKRRGQG